LIEYVRYVRCPLINKTSPAMRSAAQLGVSPARVYLTTAGLVTELVTRLPGTGRNR
jgi:hypothetical protein